MNCDEILRILHSSLPNLLAIYAFGSRSHGTFNAASDLDLAVLVEAYADPLLLWKLSGDLADRAGCPVDLVDFRAASTVLQYQIVTTGERLWAKDSRADLYEAMILSEKTELDTARAALLEDIQRTGNIYG